MKIALVILIGLVLSILTIYFFAGSIEHGDTNAVLMYFVVFIPPALILAVLNGLYIFFLTKTVNKKRKLLLCFAPSLILSLLSLNAKLTIPGFDGNLNFAAKVGAISFGLTNLIWIITLVKEKSA